MKTMTCVVCPEGCKLAADGVKITGNRCPRGLAYARQELADPKRNIATTVRLVNGKGPVLPVKTASPVPKNKIFDIMALCKSATATAPVAAGQVVIQNAAETGVDVVATASA